MKLKHRARWAIAVALAGWVGMGQGGGVGSSPIDVGQPKVVPRGVLLRPSIQSKKPIIWEKYKSEYCNPQWLDKKTGWKYSNCTNIVGTTLYIYNSVLNKSLYIEHASYSTKLGNIVYITKDAYGVQVDEDKIFKIKKFKEDSIYYPHPEIIEVDLASESYKIVSFYAWTLYGDKGIDCGLVESQSWIRSEVTDIDQKTIIFRPSVYDDKECSMSFKFSVVSDLGVYQ